MFASVYSLPFKDTPATKKYKEKQDLLLLNYHLNQLKGEQNT